MESPIENKVNQSGLLTIDLSELIPKFEVSPFDLKQFLFNGIALKEKEYREALKGFEWNQFKNKYVALFCSVNAIIPTWAFMLAAKYLQPITKDVFFGSVKETEDYLTKNYISKMDFSVYSEKKVVIKGCGDDRITPSIYVEFSKNLLPVVQSLMYGEPCSTVPVYKRKQTDKNC